MPLRVLTLNIWNDSGNWRKRCDNIRAQIRKLKPDVIAFQEVLEDLKVEHFPILKSSDKAGHTLPTEINQMNDMLAGMGFTYTFAAAQPFWGRSAKRSGAIKTYFGNAVASRWPISSTEHFRLPQSGTIAEDPELRVGLMCSIASPHGEILLVTSHLNYRTEDTAIREQQVAELARRISVKKRQSDCSFPPILCGDFNCDPDSGPIRFLTGQQSINGASTHFYDAFAYAKNRVAETSSGMTWCVSNKYTRVWHEPDRRLDYIFVGEPDWKSRGITIECEVVCQEPGPDGHFCSDHYGVLAVLSTDELTKYTKARKSVLTGALSKL